jgi:hypothetical protein
VRYASAMNDGQADESLMTSVATVLDEVVRQVEAEVIRVAEIRERSWAPRIRVLPHRATGERTSSAP